MKTSIKTLIANSLTALVLTTSLSFTALANDKKNINGVEPLKFKKIVLTGNVEVVLIQRAKEGVDYAEDNTGKAKIVQDGDVLKISSTDKDAAKLVVYAEDIYRIDASDNASVRTSGKITAKYLQIFLKNTAHAEINTNTEGLYTVIKDQADLKLSGSTENHTLIMGKTPKLTIDRFVALKTTFSNDENTSTQESVIEKQTVSIKN